MTTTSTWEQGVGEGAHACSTPPSGSWWGTKDFGHTGQVLDMGEQATSTPEPVSRTVFLQILGRIPSRVPIKELRGLRLTWGMAKVLAIIADIAGEHGDRCFASNRYIAALAGVSVRTVQHARQMARAAGLLVRQTHGAGRAKPGSYKAGGAVDVLAFPGGKDGAGKVQARLATRANLIAKSRKRINESRQAHIQAQVDLLLRTHPWIAKRIAEHLAQPHDVEGARRVMITILGRAPRRIGNPGAYVMKAISRNPQEFIGLWPSPIAKADTVAQGKLAMMMAGLTRSLAPPD